MEKYPEQFSASFETFQQTHRLSSSPLVFNASPAARQGSLSAIDKESDSEETALVEVKEGMKPFN